MSGASPQEIRAALERLRGAGRRLRNRPAGRPSTPSPRCSRPGASRTRSVRRALRTDYADATGLLTRDGGGGHGPGARGVDRRCPAIAAGPGARWDRSPGGLCREQRLRLRGHLGAAGRLAALSDPARTAGPAGAPLAGARQDLRSRSGHGRPGGGLRRSGGSGAGRVHRDRCFAGSDRDCVDALLGADCVVASGSDETIASVAAQVQPPRRLVSYGHRLSVAAVAADRPADSAARLAEDVALWDQLGCLSPLAVFVADRDRGEAAAFGAELAEALADLEERWPRGRISPASLGSHHDGNATRPRCAPPAARRFASTGAPEAAGRWWPRPTPGSGRLRFIASSGSIRSRASPAWRRP